MNSNIERREGTSGARPTAEPGVDGIVGQDQPGEWPEPLRSTCCDAPPSGSEPGGEQSLQWQAERADQIVILGRIGAYMEAEPTPRAVKAYAHRWAIRIGQLAEDIAAAKTKEATR